MIYPASFEQKTGFTSVRDAVRKLCITGGARELCDAMSMTTDPSVVEHRLRSVAEMLVIVHGDEDLAIGGVKDIKETLAHLKIPGSYLQPADLVSIGSTLRAIDAISSFFRRQRSVTDGQNAYPLLEARASLLQPMPGVVAEIERIVDRFGNILDSASPELADIRRQTAQLQSSLGARMRRVMQNAIAQGFVEPDAAPAVRDGRLVVPVAPMHKRKISGIVHDESASGKTVFIEPAEMVESNNRLRELEIAERHEIVRILSAFTDRLREHYDSLNANLEIVHELDFIHAKAEYASQIDGNLPNLSRHPELEWYHACHPVLLTTLSAQGKEIVPLDIRLTPSERMLVISGPNAGGKSVCIKTVAIVQYMLQCGLLPPLYENSHCGVFDDIMLDIGDDQSIEDDLSTYSSHLTNMKLMLQLGRRTSLVIIDELGSGTEPQIGAAIAQALLRRFNDMEMWGVITTHYQNLKTFADETPGLINGSMLYDRQQMRPLFKLSIGNPGSSFAIEIARKIGLPMEIIEDAREIVGSDYVNLDRYLLDIARDKRYWENKRQQIRVKEKKIDSVLERYEASADELRRSRREIIDDARREAERILESSNATIERTIHEIKLAQAEKEKTREARQRLTVSKEQLARDNNTDHPLLRKAPKAKKPKPIVKTAAVRELTAGDVVKLDGQPTPGRIIDISGKKATVVFGMLKTTVDVGRLKPSNASLPSAPTRSASVTALADAARGRQLSFSREIDVRGMRVDEGIQAVTYFIDDAIRFNADRVRILHGTGTGALRQAIRQYLSAVDGVATFHDEDVRFGGAGITVVELD